VSLTVVVLNRIVEAAEDTNRIAARRNAIEVAETSMIRGKTVIVDKLPVVSQTFFFCYNSLTNSFLQQCYKLKLLGLDKRTNSCIRENTRELDRELYTK